MIDPEMDFLCNLYLYVVQNISIEGRSISAVFLKCTNQSVWLSTSLGEGPLNVELTPKLISLIHQIENLQQIYPYQDPRSLYFNHRPIYKKGVFSYNPVGLLVKKLNKERLIACVEQAKVTKVSNLIKVEFMSL